MVAELCTLFCTSESHNINVRYEVESRDLNPSKKMFCWEINVIPCLENGKIYKCEIGNIKTFSFRRKPPLQNFPLQTYTCFLCLCPYRVSFLNILVFLDTPGKLQVSSKVSPAVQDLVNVNFRNLYNYIGIQMEFGPWLGSGLSRQTSTASTDHVKFLQQGAA